MKRAKLTSLDIAAENIAYIATRFPNCLTEALGADGKPVHKIDFELLKQELSSQLIEEGEERYCLNWPGKKESLLAANKAIDKTLRPIDAFSEPNRTEPNRTEPNRTEPNRTEPNRTEPNRTEPNRTEPNRTADFVCRLWA